MAPLYQSGLPAGGTSNQIVKFGATSAAWANFLNYGVNYLTANPDAEIGATTGWATYADAAANTPVDGTGGSPNSTWTTTSSSPLRGTNSFLWTKSGSANRQGEGVSYDFTIDSADQARVLAITFDYKIASGTFTASNGTTAPLNDGTTTTNAGNSDLEVFLYDKTNAVLIPVSPQVLTSNSTIDAQFKGVFQTASNSTSYRLIIHTATNTTNNFTVQFDNFFLGPSPVLYGPSVVDWSTILSFTPSSAAFGTISNATYYTRRVGDSLEALITFTAGTTAASTAQIAMPAGLSIDLSKLPGSAANTLGMQWNCKTAAGPTAWDNVSQTFGPVFSDASSTSLLFLSFKAGSNIPTKLNANAFVGTGDTVMMRFTVPISGWSSTLLMSNDTDTRVIAAYYQSNSSQSAGTGTPYQFNNKIYDNSGSVTTGSSWKFTAPVSGYYQVLVSGYNSTGSVTTDLYKNGTKYQVGASWDSTIPRTALYTPQLIAGDYIDIRPSGTVTEPNDAAVYVMVSRISGPSAIAATDSVRASYQTTATTSYPASFTTLSSGWSKITDSHNAFSSGVYTIPVSGTYYATFAIASAASSTAGSAYNQIIQAGSASTNFQSVFGNAGINEFCVNNVSGLFSCIAGDTLTLKFQAPAGTFALIGTAALQYFTVQRVGN